MARHAGLEATRTVAIILVVALHAALSFMVTPIGWAIQDRSQFVGVDLIVWVLRAFGMPLFFWLSGFAARALLERRGPSAYLRDRVLRIFLPLAVALLPMSFALDRLWAWGRDVGGRIAVADVAPKLESSELPIVLGHLWYLYYLLLVSFAALAISRVLRGIKAPPGLAMLAVPSAIAIGVLAYLGALHTNTPLGFVPDIPILVLMGGFFAWGWLVHARPQEIDRYRDRAWHALAIGGALLAVIIPSLATGRAPLYAIVATGLFTVTMLIVFVGMCVRYARPRAWLQLASEASYWTYIVHLPIVVALQILLARVAIPGVVKYAVILGVTLAVCVGSYVVVVRRLRNASRRSANQM
ncbi:MAG TPA: acyltransferase [Kofleriaceae bacterium]|nr:acyltransferase [Kofleriaceae bacterium]